MRTLCSCLIKRRLRLITRANDTVNGLDHEVKVFPHILPNKTTWLKSRKASFTALRNFYHLKDFLIRPACQDRILTHQKCFFKIRHLVVKGCQGARDSLRSKVISNHSALPGLQLLCRRACCEQNSRSHGLCKSRAQTTDLVIQHAAWIVKPHQRPLVGEHNQRLCGLPGALQKEKGVQARTLTHFFKFLSYFWACSFEFKLTWAGRWCLGTWESYGERS